MKKFGRMADTISISINPTTPIKASNTVQVFKSLFFGKATEFTDDPETAIIHPGSDLGAKGDGGEQVDWVIVNYDAATQNCRDYPGGGDHGDRAGSLGYLQYRGHEPSENDEREPAPF